jgi:hypothetical protein
MSAFVRRTALFDLEHAPLPRDSDPQWTDPMARTGRAGRQPQGWRALDLFAEHSAPPTLSPA